MQLRKRDHVPGSYVSTLEIVATTRTNLPRIPYADLRAKSRCQQVRFLAVEFHLRQPHAFRLRIQLVHGVIELLHNGFVQLLGWVLRISHRRAKQTTIYFVNLGHNT